MNEPKPERSIYIWLAYAGDWQAVFWSYNIRVDGDDSTINAKAARRILDRLLRFEERLQGLENDAVNMRSILLRHPDQLPYVVRDLDATLTSVEAMADQLGRERLSLPGLRAIVSDLLPPLELPPEPAPPPPAPAPYRPTRRR